MVRINPRSNLPHLAPALTAVILGVIVLEAFGFYARSLEYRSITALAADEAIIERAWRSWPRSRTKARPCNRRPWIPSCLLPVYGSSELNLLAAYNRPFHRDQFVPRSPHRVHDFPGWQGGIDLLDHPAKAGRGRPRAPGAESGGLPVAFLVFREAHGFGRTQYAGNFSDLHAGELAFNTRLSLRAQAGCGAADAPVPGDRGESTAPSVRPGEPGRRLPPQPRLL